MRAYIAGPMTGRPLFNFPAFFEAAARLTRQGNETVNPAQHDIDMGWVSVTKDAQGGILAVDKHETFSWDEALDWDIDQISHCDAVYLLPGWSKSRGACREYAAARTMGLLVLGAIDETPLAAVTRQPLVGLVGYAQSGKDTFASVLGYRRIAFADPLKVLSVACDPWLRTGPDAAPINLALLVEQWGWEYAKANVPGVREFLQNLGVGARDVLGSDVWVEAAFASYDPTQATVITDVRFPNEIAAIRDRGGVIVRIDRPGVGPANGHVSEFAWQATTPDWQVQNAGGLELLADHARALDSHLRAAAL